ncbi:Wzz/FepE/Etk N-terminal domain-containing protein [Arthrobacter sp. HY1533]|uniref:Wzz/FepE/Etk N-terminal domain-containing protein n=1 Tax=Arthrobacter sp. HY1533 TaxID=2970919 RepID=UPI0022B9F8FF|nr:Wzz/FepE/Etk N-terminal domain-containing protein [Arthrobacter sp. HY1533]
MTATPTQLAPSHRRSEPAGQKYRELQFGDYVQFVRAHWAIIGSALVASLLVGIAVQLVLPPQYRARTDIAVVATTNLAKAGKVPRDVSIDSAVQVLLSDQVLGKTARETNYPGRSSGLLDDLTISPLINSRILQLNVSSQTPQQALDAVTVLARNFLDARQESLNAAQEARISAIKAQLATVTASLDRPTPTDPQQAVGSESSNPALTRLQSDLQAELIALTVIDPDPGYITHAGTLPTSGTRPGFVISLASSAAVGLLLGCLMAYSKRFRRTQSAAHLVLRSHRRKDISAKAPSDRR